MMKLLSTTRPRLTVSPLPSRLNKKSAFFLIALATGALAVQVADLSYVTVRCYYFDDSGNAVADWEVHHNQKSKWRKNACILDKSNKTISCTSIFIFGASVLYSRTIVNEPELITLSKWTSDADAINIIKKMDKRELENMDKFALIVYGTHGKRKALWTINPAEAGGVHDYTEARKYLIRENYACSQDWQKLMATLTNENNVGDEESDSESKLPLPFSEDTTSALSCPSAVDAASYQSGLSGDSDSQSLPSHIQPVPETTTSVSAQTSVQRHRRMILSIERMPPRT